MNEHDVITRLSALPDRDLAVQVDLDTVITTAKWQRERRQAVTGTIVAIAILIAGLIVVINQSDRPAKVAAPGAWTVNSPGLKAATLGAVAPISQSDVWAIGSLLTEQPAGLALHWDGKQWTRFSMPGLVDVSAVASNDVWAVGATGSGAGIQEPLAMHWDGSSWREVPVPARGSQSRLTAVAAVAADDVWAIGNVASQDSGGRPYIVHWDGRSWLEVPTPVVPGATDMLLRGISAAAGNDIWVAGMSNAAPGELPVSLHWDGSQWSTIPVTDKGDDLREILAVAPNEAWGLGRTGRYRWDGSRWRTITIPEQVDGNYWTIAPDGAGGILLAGGKGQIQVARWNGTEWARIKPPVDADGSIQDLSPTPGTGVIWAAGTISGPATRPTGPGREDEIPIVASISFTPGKPGR